LYGELTGRLIVKNKPISEKKVNSDFSIDIEPLFTVNTGDFSKIYNNGFGGLVALNKSVSSNSVIFLESGLINFNGIPLKIGTNISITPPKLTIIPINLGFKYNLEKVYVGVSAGVGLSKVKDATNTNGDLMINPFVGYEFNKFKISFNYSVLKPDLDYLKYFSLKASFRLINLNNSTIN
jgi:hypothetical protein